MREESIEIMSLKAAEAVLVMARVVRIRSSCMIAEMQ